MKKILLAVAAIVATVPSLAGNNLPMIGIQKQRAAQLQMDRKATPQPISHGSVNEDALLKLQEQSKASAETFQNQKQRIINIKSDAAAIKMLANQPKNQPKNQPQIQPKNQPGNQPGKPSENQAQARPDNRQKSEKQAYAVWRDPQAELLPPYFEGQWNQKYNSYDGKRLRTADRFVGKNQNDATKVGGITYYYDADGYEYAREDIYVAEVLFNGEYVMEKSWEEEDNQHRNLLIYRQDPQTKEWYLTMKDYCIHGMYGGDIEAEYARWDDNRNELVTYNKTTAQYDAQHRPVLTTQYYYSEDKDDMIPSYKCEYEYDAEGYPTITEYYFVQSESGNYWDPSSKYKSYRDAFKYYYESYYWSNDKWYGYYKEYSEYDSENRTILDISYDWNSSLGEFVPKQKSEYDYNTYGSSKLYRKSTWDSSTQDWVVSEERHYEYVLPGDSVLSAEWYIRYYTSGVGGRTAYGDRTEYVEDALGRTKVYITYSLVTDDPLTWKGDYRYEYEYAGNDPDEDAYQTTESIWDEASNQWILSNRTRSLREDLHQFMELSSWDGTQWVMNYYSERKYIRIDGERFETLYIDLNAYGEYATGSKAEYSYDPETIFWVTKEYEWDNETNDWRPIYYGEQRDNAQGQNLYFYGANYDPWYNMWNVTKQEREYDQNGNITMLNSYEGQGEALETVELALSNYEKFTYDAKGRLIADENLTASTDEETGERVWSYGSQTVSEYNAQDSLAATEVRYYDAESGQFVPNMRQEFTYGTVMGSYCCVGSAMYDWNAEEQKWDKNMYEQVREEGNKIYSETYIRNDEDEWYVAACTTTEIDPATGSISMIASDYDYGEEKLVPRERFDYNNIAGGTEIVSYYWDGYSNSWTGTSKVINTTVDGIVTEESYRWNYDNWYGISKNCYSVDAWGYRTYDESFNWGGDAWVNYSKMYAQHDSLGGILNEEYYRWDSYSNEWYGTSKNENGFDEDHTRTMWSSWSWDYENKTWKGQEKTVCVNDTLGHQLHYEYYRGMVDGKWYGQEKQDNAYDAKGNQVLCVSYIFDETRMEWAGYYKYEYEYDEYGSQTLYSCYGWDSEKWDWKGLYKYAYYYEDRNYVSEDYEWDINAGCWVGRSRSVSANVVDEWSISSTYTTFTWVNGSWALAARETYYSRYSTDYNIATSIATHETYDGGWVMDGYEKLVYNYTSSTDVQAAQAELQARIIAADGMISVEAAEGTAISVAAMGGSEIAAGNGSVSVAAPAGIYLIKVGSETYKVLAQ